MPEPTADRPDGSQASPIVNVGEMPVEQLLLGKDSVLDNALRRVLDDLAQAGENYAAHSSSS